MTISTTLRASAALLLFVMGSVQAWDSHAHTGGWFVVLLVSLAIALPAVAWLVPLKPVQFVGAVMLSLVLLVVARFASPTPLPGLFLVGMPAGVALIFAGVFLKQNGQDPTTANGQ